MDLRVTGKQLFYRALYASVLICMNISAHITLQVMDLNKQPISQAQLGVPFILEVSFDGNGNKPLSVGGIEQFQSRYAGSHIAMVNSYVKTTYAYELRADKEGTYTLGPVVVMVQGNRVESQTIKIRVGDEQKVVVQQNAKKNAKQAADCLVRCSLDKKRVVVGEKATVTMRIYTKKHDIHIKQLLIDQVPGITRKNVQQLQSGQEEINGTLYFYAQVAFDVYAQEPGKKVFPACGVEYEIPTEWEDMLSAFLSFRMSRTDSKRIYSNALELMVDPLPPTDKKVNAIGSFSNFKAAISPAAVRQAEGMLLTLDLEGLGDFEDVNFPDLMHMPESFKYYQSKSYMLPESSNGKSVKRFEYIVQGLEAGEFEIPSQELFYFDVDKRAYKTLKTMPLMVKILPGASNNALKKNDDAFEDDAQADGVKKEDLAPLRKDGPWNETREWGNFSFVKSLISLFIILLVSFAFCVRRLLAQYENSQHKTSAKRAYKKAREDLSNALKEGHAERVYSIFIAFIAAKKGLAISDVSAVKIESLLRDASMSQEKLSAWNEFYSRMEEYAFASKNVDVRVQEFFKNAMQWIQTLKDLL